MINFSNLFSRFSIKQQILIGFMPVFIILVFLGFTSHEKFQTFFTNFETLSRNTQESLIFQEIDHDMIELQRSVLVYSYAGYSGVLRKVEHLQETIDQKLIDVMPAAEKNEEIKQRLDRLKSHYTAYKNGFETAVKKRKALKNIQSTKFSALNEEINQHLNDAVKFAEESADIELFNVVVKMQQDITQINLNILSFQIRPDGGLINNTKSLLESVRKNALLVEKQVEAPNIKTKIAQVNLLSENYAVHFGEMVNINSNYLHLVNVVLAGKASEIDRLSDELDSLVNKKNTVLTQQILANSRDAEKDYLLLSVAAGLIGLLSALLVAVGIAKPVQAMTQTLSDLAKGKKDTKIPGQTRRDEIGEMATAANEFKTMVDQIERQTIEIQEASTFQDLILNTIPDFVFVKDEEFKIVEANKAFLNNYPKNKRDKVIGSTTLEEYDPEQVELFLVNDRIALKDGYNEAQETVDFPDGTERVLFTKKIGFDSLGKRYLLGISRDITNMKRAEEEILRSNEELERFAYIASHDLQEPLRMVASFTALLEEEYRDDLDDQAKQYIDFTTSAARRMQKLVSDLLEFSRVGHDETGLTNFDSLQKLESAIENLNEAIEETGAIISYDETFPEIHANPVRFSRLLQNLIGNALKYRDKDRTPEIHIGVEERDNDWIFSVKDNGIGIKEEYLEQIFVIFKRLHNKDEYTGTGIGLAVCKKIVESLGGQLWVESTLEKGSIFYFSVPKQKALKTESE